MPLPSVKDVRSADLFKLLSSPRRLQIIRCIMQNDMANVTYIKGMVGLTHDATCHHLSWMAEKGYVRSVKKGRFVLYTVPREAYTVSEYNLLSNLKAQLL